jgi:hypothetical protein
MLVKQQPGVKAAERNAVRPIPRVRIVADEIEASLARTVRL